MDPALADLIEEGDAEDEVAVVVRLAAPAPPPALTIVAQFGPIATCRVARGAIVAARAAPEVESVKAPHSILAEPDVVDADAPAGRRPTDERRPPGLDVTGRGVVLGMVDFGVDFAHPDFRTAAAGGTRLLALWDQRGGRTPTSPAPYGYGRVHAREAIDRALRAADPYAALGYHPADADPDDSGTHGSHCLSIAAGSGHAAPAGVAPEAELVFVHLTSSDDVQNLGDSVRLLEAVHFIAGVAAGRPYVISLSLGNFGGPHDGTTLVEQGLDHLLATPGVAICQSTGNYHNRPVHATGVLRPGTSRVVTWETDPADTTPNRFETWYAGVDVFVVELRAPGAVATVRARIGERLPVVVGGRTVGRIQQRVHEPNNGMNHLEIALDADAPAGAWEVELVGDDVADGRYHCWVERDAGCPHCQSLLLPADAVSTTTTGTICNGFRTIAVGAYDAHARDRPIAAFSSAGPTLDGRVKPDLVAPGLQVSGACSAGRRPDPGRPLTTRKSGTSMAAPCVAGAVCLLFEAAGRPLPIADTRRILLGSVDRVTPGADPERRYGDGYLQIAEAVAVARAHARRTTDRRAA